VALNLLSRQRAAFYVLAPAAGLLHNWDPMKSLRQWFEYAALWLALKFLGLLRRRTARALGAAAASALFALRPPLGRTALFNLKLAFPEWTDERRREVVRGMVRQLGWMAGEFSQFPKYARGRIEDVVKLDGLENFLAAKHRGKGVLFLTGHLGAWELAPFAQACYGHPLHFLVRAIDNPHVDALINGYRSLSGNAPIDKNQSARAILRILQGGGTVGILADQNTLPGEAVFVDFFGISASTTSGIARVALHTGAAVVPGYIFWDEPARKYCLRLEPEIELSRTGDLDRDILDNTARFTRVIEDYIRRYPDQWVWVHKRWKIRPEGAPPIYPF
jgi:KDO2-lipid IV(A) lauroyltransferase